MTVMNTETERPPGGRGRYPKEFRRDAAALVIDQHRTVANVARELGVVEQTLGNWVRQERIDAAWELWRLQTLEEDGAWQTITRRSDTPLN